MAGEHRSSLIPLTEFTRSIPPGWKPGLHNYPFKQYTKLLRLWWRSKNIDEDPVAAIIVAGRLQGTAHRRALNFRITRDGTEHIADNALVLPADHDIPNHGDERPSGFTVFLAALAAEFGLHEQDATTKALDDFFECKRSGDMLTYISDFQHVYEEAHDSAQLTVNDVCLSYLLLRGCGLPTAKIDDIKLKVNGDMSQYRQILALLTRLAKQEQNGHHDHRCRGA